MDSYNPFEPPTSEPARIESDPLAFVELVRGWEKLRLIYNAILLPAGIGVLALWIHRHHIPPFAAIVLGVMTGVGANSAFFLGPIAELYIRGFFRNGAPIGKGRTILFAAGLMVSAVFFLFAAYVAFL